MHTYLAEGREGGVDVLCFLLVALITKAFKSLRSSQINQILQQATLKSTIFILFIALSHTFLSSFLSSLSISLYLSLSLSLSLNRASFLQSSTCSFLNFRIKGTIKTTAMTNISRIIIIIMEL
jgi:hypothetical protein